MFGTVGNAKAADAKGNFAIEGAGQLKCETYMTLGGENQTEFATVASWLNGYVTAYNRFAPETFDLTPWQTVQVLLVQLRQYCNANPGAAVEKAASELVNFLSEDRLTRAENMIALSNGKNAVMVYESTRAKIEAALIARDFTIRDVEGGLSLAILEFQTSKGLPATGLPDQRTLLGLFAPL